MCYNFVLLSSDNKENLQKAFNFINQMIERQDKENCGQLVNNKIVEYWFDVSISNDEILQSNDGWYFQLNFTSKWSPTQKSVKELSKLFKLDYEYQYEELGCSVYGIDIFENGKLESIYLTREEIIQIDSECSDDDSIGEMLDDLIEQKRKQLQNGIS